MVRGKPKEEAHDRCTSDTMCGEAAEDGMGYVGEYGKDLHTTLMLGAACRALVPNGLA